ncbi:hypothetical protein B296_00055306, partial [Ensete ventricosum]
YEHDFYEKNVIVINFVQNEFRSVFCAPSRKFKILVIPNILAHGKSYEHSFTKKCDGHKLCVKSHANEVSIGFLCTVSEIQNTDHSQRISPLEVVRAWFPKK